MGKRWQNFKRILSENFNKNLKKIVERAGIWLIALMQISIPVMLWVCGFIDISVLSTAAFASYVVTVEMASFGIGKIFKNGNGNGNHTKTS